MNVSPKVHDIASSLPQSALNAFSQPSSFSSWLTEEEDPLLFLAVCNPGNFSLFLPQMMLSSVPPQQFAPFNWQQQHPRPLQSIPPQHQQQHQPQQQGQLLSGRHALSSEDVRYGAGAFSDGEAERSTRRRSGGGGVGGGSYYGSMQHYHQHNHRPRRQSEALDWRSMASRQPHYVTLTRYMF